MIAGIVGHEAAKFTLGGEQAARMYINQILSDPAVTIVTSGACHLGGIDVWAAQEGHQLGLQVVEFPPETHKWEGGYKQRNIRIAEYATIVYNLVVDRLPENYKGMRFPLCYHCKSADHVKSGGCWTAKYAQRLGKPAHWIVVHQ